MNTKRIASTVAALFCSTALISGLAACSSDDDKSDSKTTTSAAAMSGSETSGAETSKSESSSGASSITVDGTEWTGSYTTLCAKRGDVTALTLSDVSGDATKGVAASVKSDGTVTSVALGEVSQGLGYAPGVPDASATLKQEGNTFTITGVAVGIDLANPTTPKKSEFEVVFACDEIVTAPN